MSESIKNIAPAFAKAQGEIKNVYKSEMSKDKNGKKKYGYAPLPDVLEEIRRVSAKHGIFTTQDTSIKDNKVLINTCVFHESGEFFMFKNEVPFYKLQYMNEYQVMGSSFTYLRRYMLSSIFGIAADEDNDVNLINNRTQNNYQNNQKNNNNHQNNEKKPQNNQKPARKLTPVQEFDNKIKTWIVKDVKTKQQKIDISKYVLSMYEINKVVELNQKDFEKFDFDVKSRFALSKIVLNEFEFSDYSEIEKNNLVRDYYERIEELLICDNNEKMLENK